MTRGGGRRCGSLAACAVHASPRRGPATGATTLHSVRRMVAPPLLENGVRWWLALGMAQPRISLALLAILHDGGGQCKRVQRGSIWVEQMARSRGELHMLTARECETAKPGRKPIRLFDGGGLFLNITRSGAKAWSLKWMADGKDHEMGL